MNPKVHQGKRSWTSVATLSFVLLSVGLTACSIKAEGGTDPITPPATKSRFADKKASVAGPPLEGEWESACIAVAGTTSFRKIRVRFNGDQADRMQLRYLDGRCERLESALADKGAFRFIETFPDGGFTIEYSFDYGNGVVTNPQEKVWKDTFEVYLADFRTSDTLSRAQSYRLTRVGGVSDSKPLN
jgi:hypothetical protein